MPVYYRHFLSWQVFLLVIAIKLGVFVIFGFYNRWWRYVSTRDMWRAVQGVTVACLVADLVLYALPQHDTFFHLPKRIVALDYLLLLAFVAGTRLLTRTLIERPKGGIVARGKNVLIVGAGDAGQLVVREMQRNRRLAHTPVGFVDDDPGKRNLRIHGVRVLGTTDELGHVIREYRPDEILIAMPSAPGDVRRKIVEAARREGLPVKTLPGLHELIAGDPNLAGQIRSVQVEDVLGREQVEVDLEAIAGVHPRPGRARDRRAAARSAPSSAARSSSSGPSGSCSSTRPSRRSTRCSASWSTSATSRPSIPVLADCGDAAKMRQVFERYPPEVVFHAAAYKHVPMLETNPIQAVTNNVLATRGDRAGRRSSSASSGSSSSRPTRPRSRRTCSGSRRPSANGSSSRSPHRDDVATRFVAVRFGNVLGSSGSVIPIFRRQIERGGPVTVTNPEMTRFFMTIPEAASLVVQAGAMGGRGQVYVLDMGQPVKIIDLARQMIALSGRTENEIKIEFVGSRAGEKMHEELWNGDEEVGATKHPKIMRATRPPIDPEWLYDGLAELEALVVENDVLGVTAKLRQMVAAPKRLTGQPVLEDTLH